VRILHARPEVADLLGSNPCKTQSQNQLRVLEYVTGSERVMERSMLLVRQTVAVVALLFSLISLVGWMAFLVFAGNMFLEGHLLPVLGIGAGGLIAIGVLVGGWPNGWGRRAWYKCVSKSLRL
jgi:hypothetical protein